MKLVELRKSTRTMKKSKNVYGRRRKSLVEEVVVKRGV